MLDKIATIKNMKIIKNVLIILSIPIIAKLVVVIFNSGTHVGSIIRKMIELVGC